MTIYDLFQEALDSGLSPTEAMQAILQDDEVQRILTLGGDSWEDECQLYIALAEIQLEFDMLQPDICEMGIQAIETALAFDETETQFGDPKHARTAAERREWLLRLHERLTG